MAAQQEAALTAIHVGPRSVHISARPEQGVMEPASGTGGHGDPPPYCTLPLAVVGVPVTLFTHFYFYYWQQNCILFFNVSIKTQQIRPQPRCLSRSRDQLQEDKLQGGRRRPHCPRARLPLLAAGAGAVTTDRAALPHDPQGRPGDEGEK